MTVLSVNINKVATLRNARGEGVPDVQRFATECERLGAGGITVHPRPDGRHITYDDVYRLRPLVKTEFNIEGYPSDEFMDLVVKVRPEQVTLVPDAPGVLTSSEGWDVEGHLDLLTSVIERLRGAGIRSSVFVEPDAVQIRAAAAAGADRVELYTKPYAMAFGPGTAACPGLPADADTADAAPVEPVEEVAPYVAASLAAHQAGLGVNAGHDLNLANLAFFHASLPYLNEVSIGHALISDALYLGLPETIRRYLDCLR